MTPDAIIADNNRLRQVLINLLNNAVKFTDQGEIVLSATELTPKAVDQSVQGDGIGRMCTLQFAVRDTGIGIPKDRMDRLFKSFSQVDASTTRRYGGTGLGLAISRRLVELMGGEIWVDVPSTVDVEPSLSFSLAGAVPNPAVRRDLSVTFTLASAARATLSLRDVNGRVVSSREVGSLGPGGHSIAFGRDRELPAGMYFLTLDQGEQRATRRVVLL